MQACDALDGVTDGVIDNVPACQAGSIPVTATYMDYAGALGPAQHELFLAMYRGKERDLPFVRANSGGHQDQPGPRRSNGGAGA